MSADDDVKLQSIEEMMSYDEPIDLFATDDSFMKAGRRGKEALTAKVNPKRDAFKPRFGNRADTAKNMNQLSYEMNKRGAAEGLFNDDALRNIQILIDGKPGRMRDVNWWGYVPDRQWTLDALRHSNKLEKAGQPRIYDPVYTTDGDLIGIKRNRDGKYIMLSGTMAQRRNDDLSGTLDDENAYSPYNEKELEKWLLENYGTEKQWEDLLNSVTLDDFDTARGLTKEDVAYNTIARNMDDAFADRWGEEDQMKRRPRGIGSTFRPPSIYFDDQWSEMYDKKEVPVLDKDGNPKMVPMVNPSTGRPDPKIMMPVTETVRTPKMDAQGLQEEKFLAPALWKRLIGPGKEAERKQAALTKERSHLNSDNKERMEWIYAMADELGQRAEFKNVPQKGREKIAGMLYDKGKLKDEESVRRALQESNEEFNIREGGKNASIAQSTNDLDARSVNGPHIDALDRIHFNPDDMVNSRVSNAENQSIMDAIRDASDNWDKENGPGSFFEKFPKLKGYDSKPMFPDYDALDKEIYNGRNGVLREKNLWANPDVPEYESEPISDEALNSMLGDKYRSRNLKGLLDLARTALKTSPKEGIRGNMGSLKGVAGKATDLKRKENEALREQIERRGEGMKHLPEEKAKIHDMGNPTGDIQPIDMPLTEEAIKAAGEYGKDAAGAQAIQSDVYKTTPGGESAVLNREGPTSTNVSQIIKNSQSNQENENMEGSSEEQLQENQEEQLPEGQKTTSMTLSMDSENVNTDEPFTKSIADIMDEDDLNLAEAMYIRTPYNLVVMQTGEPMKIEAPSETKGSEEHHVKNKMPSINDLMDN